MANKEKIENLVKELARQRIKSSEDFLNLVKNLTKKYQITSPSNVEILESYKSLRSRKKIRQNPYFEKLLKKRPIRSLSGVAVVSVLTKPYPCPGDCLYCPIEKGIPKSYLSGEPAVERAKKLKYDPYQQVKKRIEVLQKIGHSTDKIELIIIGASWTAYPKKYQEWFIKRCFQAANEANSKFQIPNSKNLEEVQRRNERAKNRIIGISVETRPDLITPEEIKRMRELGITRIELGVQALDEKILAKNQRGHGIKEIVEATRLLKEAGFKICYHWMPNLLGSNPKKDLMMFKKLFSNPSFQPDYLKIYPCVVTKGSKLYQLWCRKKYKPYSDKTLIELLIKMKKIVPPYLRIIRIFRDIPSSKILGGTKISNLHQVVKKEMTRRGLRCCCIRCREIKDWKLEMRNLKLVKREYKASDGKEIFLSFEDKEQDKILAFLRLRLTLSLPNYESKRITNVLSVLKNAAIIRELHTYGELVEIGKKKKGAPQHKNLGKKLVKEAEKIVRRSKFADNFRISRIAVISGIGSREYWKKLGYKLQETYMIKNI